MAVTLRGTPNGTNNTSGTTNVVTKPTGVVSGDILILDVGWGPTGTTATPPAGFALLQSTALSDNSWTQSLYWKIAGGSEPSTYTTTFSGSTFSDTIMIAYQGEDPAATPLSSANSGTGTTETGLGLTFTVNGSILLHCTVSNTGARTSGPAGMVNEILFDGNIYIDDEARNSGASGDRTSVYPSQIWLSQMVGIQPAAPVSASYGLPSRPLLPFLLRGPSSPLSTGPRLRAVPGTPSATAVTVGLTGVSGTGQVGSVTPSTSLGMTGNAATAGVGSVTSSTSVALTGTLGSGAVGSVTSGSDVTVGITGVAATGQSGTIAASTAHALTGNAATGSPGTLSPATTAALAGNAASGQVGSVISPGAVTPRYAPSANGRHHVDSVTGRRVPFLLDSAWAGPNGANLTDWGTYLDDRRAKGYTGVIVQLMTLGSALWTPTGTPADFAGNQPFLLNASGTTYTGTVATADFSTPNDTYWANVYNYIKAVNDRGMVAVCYPEFWGFGGSGTEGAALDIVNSVNTNSVCTGLGAYLANGHGSFAGFKTLDGLVIADGGDYGANNGSPPSATLKSRTLLIAQAMQANGCTHLRYFDGQSPSMGTDEISFTNECQTQAVYTYGGVFGVDGPTSPALHTYQQSRLGWQYAPVAASQGPTGATAAPPALPAWLKETVYAWDTSVEGRTVTRAEVRKAEYWAWLSGCTAGRAHGNAKIWSFPGGGVWQGALSDAYELDAAILNSVFLSVQWSDFVPSEQSGKRRLITSSNGTQSGTPDSYVAAVETWSGTQLLAYVPTFSTGTQSITVDLTGMSSARLVAQWIDPTTGTASAAGTFGRSSQALVTPGTNAGGDNDWILQVDAIVEAPPASLSPFRVVGPGRFQPGPHPQRQPVFFGSAPSTPTVTVALTGVSATGGAGTVSPAAAAVVTGAAVTGSPGSVGPTVAAALAGAVATTAVGTLTPAITGVLSGVAATSAAGTAAPTTAVALSGVAATGQAGSVSASVPGTAGLTGVSGAGGTGTLGPAVTVALTGVAGSTAIGGVGPGTAIGVSGVAATGGTGTISTSATVALSGASGGGAAGSVVPGISRAATGVSGTGSVGAPGVIEAIALTGVAGAGQTGSVAPSVPGAAGITGVQGIGGTGAVGAAVTLPITGVSATGGVGSIAGVSVTSALTGVSGAGAVGTVLLHPPNVMKRRMGAGPLRAKHKKR